MIYLAGPIRGCTDDEATGWRARAKALLRHPTIDPMRRDYRGAEAEVPAFGVVEPDVDDIRASSIVLAMCERPSWGTAMEIAIARWVVNRPVIAVCSEATPSLWLTYHALVLPSLEGACAVANMRMDRLIQKSY